MKKACIFLLLMIFITSFLSCQNKTQIENCFDSAEFEAVYNYAIWKDKTSKIGKILVNDYRVEIDKESKMLLFKNDKEDYTIFKVSQEKGVILLPVKQSKKLEKKANKAYCELVELARFHPVPKQD